MFYRISPIALCLITLWALIWNAWFRPSTYGDAVVGDAYAALYAASTTLPGLLQSLFSYDALSAGLVMSPGGIFAVLAMVFIAGAVSERQPAPDTSTQRTPP